MASDAIAVDKAVPIEGDKAETPPAETEASLFSSYIGLSFALFLGLLPKLSLSYVSSLQSRNRILATKLFEAEDQLRTLRSRGKEDAKANARVAEIFAGHRARWQQEDRRLLLRVDAAEAEISGLRARLEETERERANLNAALQRLEREVAERDEMLEFMARKEEGGGGGLDSVEDSGTGGGFTRVRVPEERLLARNGKLVAIQQNSNERELFMPSEGMKQWTDQSSGWQNMLYDSLDTTNSMKHLVARRESPWKVDSESSGISTKLKLLEEELVYLEKVGAGDLSKITSLMRKQAKRYQSLAGKVDALCRKMRMNEPCDPTLTPEFRTQRQTEFLLEAFRLQNCASETRQKLSSVQAESIRRPLGDGLTAEAKSSARKSLDSVRNKFKEIQRSLEIWLARTMGDLEGILARDGASRVREYCLSPFPFVY
ncbi:uncharacterized protein LOC122007962 [Zingiber officinale]|uniref:Uncharacterized protein n=1 Tax=Zingiber officinale TaxID=94328 RepID=A0A8J5FDG4_ZINOF|nr:uncharacterized protein LOC122007962 [Zingiber officinale]KAG6485521.1 hypothetical protein ZIOFF_054081 [Zingiber officinale]